MNRFLNEDNGLQMAFLDGNQPDRVCAPMKAFVEGKGGVVKMEKPLKEIVTNADGSVKHLLMRDGSTVKMRCRRRCCLGLLFWFLAFEESSIYPQPLYVPVFASAPLFFLSPLPCCLPFANLRHTHTLARTLTPLSHALSLLPLPLRWPTTGVNGGWRWRLATAAAAGLRSRRITT